MDVFNGIDVVSAKGKSLPITICKKENNRLEPLPLQKHPTRPPKGFFNVAILHNNLDSLYLKTVRKYIEIIGDGDPLRPVCIEIDSPLHSRDSCLHRRAAEQTLDKAGMTCFKTPPTSEFDAVIQKEFHHFEKGNLVKYLPHTMQRWMLAGFAVAEELSQCIEVYPQATARALEVTNRHKSKGRQADKQLMAISRHSCRPQKKQEWGQIKHICSGAIHNKVSACRAASLNEQHITAYVDPEKGDSDGIPF